ncbi:PREDICTED: kallikrein-11 isoform X2 [Chinchilla lanigera]|nr:PREDICTED: kallikrein-11 isoform X2 [Chinchilla lanigera]
MPPPTPPQGRAVTPMEQMKKLSLAGVESLSPRHRGRKRQSQGWRPGLAAVRARAYPALLHIWLGERGEDDQQRDLAENTPAGSSGDPQPGFADEETEVAHRPEVIGLRLHGIQSLSPSLFPEARPVPLQAMRILRLITLALVTGHVGGETRIIKGYPCRPHSQPWQVALFQKTRLLCGATLIAPRWLLTAAHCRKPHYQVLLGGHNLHQDDGCEQRQTATESFPHPHFNNSLPNKDHRNDIMLVKLPKAASITRAVRPLALPSRCVTAGTSCLISGWGTTSSPQLRLPHTLRCANISIIQHEECEGAYPGNITDTMVCASVQKG